jgi:hypothetical protein
VALELTEGFESGSLAGYGTTGTPTIVSTEHNSGANSLQINGASAIESIQYIPNPVAPQVSVGRIYFKFNTMPGVGTSVTIVVPHTNTAKNASMRVTAAGAMQCLWTGGTSQTIAGLTVVAGQWYRLDWKAVVGPGTTLTLDATVNDGATDFPLGTQATLADVATTIGTEIIGNNNATTADLYLDDLAISRTAGDYPIGAVPPPSTGSRQLALMGVGS